MNTEYVDIENIMVAMWNTAKLVPEYLYVKDRWRTVKYWKGKKFIYYKTFHQFMAGVLHNENG